MWVDDPASPLYNQHFVLKHDPVTPWEFKQQMKLNDYAHSLKLFIRHNAADGRQKPVPGAGSSIFSISGAGTEEPLRPDAPQ